MAIRWQSHLATTDGATSKSFLSYNSAHLWAGEVATAPGGAERTRNGEQGTGEGEEKREQGSDERRVCKANKQNISEIQRVGNIDFLFPRPSFIVCERPPALHHPLSYPLGTWLQGLANRSATESLQAKVPHGPIPPVDTSDATSNRCAKSLLSRTFIPPSPLLPPSCAKVGEKQTLPKTPHGKRLRKRSAFTSPRSCFVFSLPSPPSLSFRQRG